MRVSAACLFVLLAAGAAQAGDQEAPVATGRGAAAVPAAAPVTAIGAEPAAIVDGPAMTTEEKIQAWRREGESAAATAEAPPLLRERRIHGEVSAWVGSHGVRGGSVVLSAPFGDSGAATIGASRSEGRVLAPVFDAGPLPPF
jgi:hypothetical protein